MLANHYLKTDNLETCSQLCNHMIKSVADPNEEVLVVSYDELKKILFY